MNKLQERVSERRKHTSAGDRQGHFVTRSFGDRILVVKDRRTQFTPRRKNYIVYDATGNEIL